MKKYLLLAAGIFILLGFQQNKKVVVYLAGDSTIAQKKESKKPETGWGEKFGGFFNENVVIKNHAKNGRSTRTFIEEGKWQAIVDSLEAGNYVFIQFGHNDQSKNKVDRYTPPDDFKKNLTQFVLDVRNKNGIPVLITPVVRRRFNEEGEFYDVHGDYPNLVREVATKEKVDLIELHGKSETLIQKLGKEKSKELFLWLEPSDSKNYPNGLEDNTHFSEYGAQIIAGLVVDALRESNIELVYNLKEKW